MADWAAMVESRDALIADLNDHINRAWSEVRVRDRRIAELEQALADAEEKVARQLRDCRCAEAP